jgi:hypothetical protein
MHCLAERPPKNYPNPKSWTSPLRQKISFGAFKNNLIHVKKLRKTTKHCKQQAVREEIEKQENSRNNQKKTKFSLLCRWALHLTIGAMRQKLFFFVFMPNGSWPSSSGLRGHRKTYLTILESAWSANLKMV